MGKNIAYLRVSTVHQETEKNKNDILVMANAESWGRVEFVEEKVSGKKPWRQRQIAGIVAGLQQDDKLIVPELSRLGRSMLEIIEIMAHVREAGAVLIAVKGGWRLDDSIQSKIIGTVFAMAAEIERDLISERTREALAAKKAAGVVLGRPRGPGKSKLDDFGPEIVALLKNGSTKTFVANKYGCSIQNLTNWIKKNKIEI